MNRDVPMEFDIIVIGGGVVGAGVARDAAMRGYSVALYEKDDFAAGTTSRSTRLVHGGLRYLKTMDFGLVREALRERKRLLKNAPHLVKPIPFLFPVYRGHGTSLLRLWPGMVLYDFLSAGKHLPRHRMLTPGDTLAREPALIAKGLLAGFVYYDAQCSYPERLVMETLVDAERHSAVVQNHTKVIKLLVRDGRVRGVRTQEQETMRETDVHAKVVINCAGPWVDQLLREFGLAGPPRLRRSKGIHIVTPRMNDHALIMETEDGERVFFAIPWEEYTMLGTTDTEFRSNTDRVAADAEDIDYLLEQINDKLDVDVTREDILFTTAGVRALPAMEDEDVGTISRRHVLVDHGREGGPERLYSVVGGKITSYRAIAEDVVDHVKPVIGKAVRRCRTASAPLPGATPNWHDAKAELFTEAREAGLDEGSALHVVETYGARAAWLINLCTNDATMAHRIVGDRPDIMAEIDLAVRLEHATTIEDVLLRRTTLGLSHGVGIEAGPVVLARMAKMLGWSEDRQAHERNTYLNRIRLMAPIHTAEARPRPPMSVRSPKHR